MALFLKGPKKPNALLLRGLGGGAVAAAAAAAAMPGTTKTTYPDLRVMYVRLLCKDADLKTRNARHTASALPQVCRAIVSIALHDGALYSHHQAGELKHVGEGYKSFLKEKLEDKGRLPGYLDVPPPRGRFASAAEALLVVLREYEEEEGAGAEMPGAQVLGRTSVLFVAFRVMRKCGQFTKQ